MAFGAWPELPLIEARTKRDEARREIARGIDPGEKLKLDRITAEIAAAITFRSVAEEWLTKTEKEGLSAVTLKKNRWLLAFTFDKLGHRPIAEITPHELLVVLRKVEARGRHGSAKRIPHQVLAATALAGGIGSKKRSGFTGACLGRGASVARIMASRDRLAGYR